MTEPRAPRILVAFARRGRDVADAELRDARSTCACSEARRIGLPWPSRTPCRTSTKSRCASICTMWIGASSLKARMQGMLTAWSPPSTTGSAFRSRILRTAISALRVARGGVGVDDVGVADIDDPHLVHRQIDRIVLVVVGAAVAEGEERRRFADRARPEARARRGIACPCRRARRAPRHQRRAHPSRDTADACRRCNGPRRED